MQGILFPNIKQLSLSLSLPHPPSLSSGPTGRHNIEELRWYACATPSPPPTPVLRHCRPGRLPHQQRPCEARLGYQDGSPQLGAPGPETRQDRHQGIQDRMGPGMQRIRYVFKVALWWGGMETPSRRALRLPGPPGFSQVPTPQLPLTNRYR